ncbi:MAG: BCCT family transporter [Planctomycetaceae bacterium]|nr:BCCT family transporter [Planctomycetaceae bacterium]
MAKKLRPSIIIFPSLIFITLIIIGFINAEAFITTLNGWFVALMTSFGWLISVGMLLFIAFMLVLLFHPIGNIRLGGPNAQPRLTTWQWFSIALCAGIGTGVVFWGSVEPLLFTMQPAPSLHLEPGGNDAIIWAMRTTFLHWTFTPYAIYVTFGVILAYVCYNMRKDNNVSSGFIPLLGNGATKGTFAAVVDIFTVFAIIGGVCGSLGYGILQLGIGMDIIFGVKPSNLLSIAICGVIVLVYIGSSISGLRKGIMWLSDKNAWIFMIMLAFVLFCGPTAYIMNLLTQSAGSYLNNFVESMTYTAPFPDGQQWPQWWDMYWWTDWLSYGPIMGLFLVRLGYGRTIRTFVIVNWMLPSLFGFVWFAIFGGTVIHAQIFEGIDLFATYKSSGAEAMTFATFDLVPLAAIVKPIMLITIALSFITLANSMTSTVATMSLKDNSGVSEAPMWLKIFWGLLIGAASLVFTLSGGIDGIKMVKTFAGFPILFVGLVMLGGFAWYMSKRPRNELGDFVYESAVANAPDSDEPPLRKSQVFNRISAAMKRRVVRD